MTASQPPEPPQGQPGWGQEPPPGYPQQPPPGAPGFGQGYGQAPSWSSPPPGWGQQPPPGYAPQGYGPAPRAASPGVSVDFKRLRMADYVVAGGTLLFFILALLPWRDYGDEFFGPITLSGFSSGAVSSAFVLFLLATAWALMPAFYDLNVGFPRAWITVGLAALGFLLTLVAWIGSFDAGFSLWALLGLLTAAAILLFALFSLLPQLRNGPAVPGALAGAAQWANQPAPDPTAGQQDRPTHGTPPPPPPAPWAAPGATSGTGAPATGTSPPPPPGYPEPPGERPPAP